MNLLNILLQAQQGNSWSGMLLILAMIVVFYFFMIRPQSKKQKEIKKAREAMQKGDAVVTAGGIYGRIKEVKETTFIITIAEGVNIKIEKTSVYAAPDPADQAKK